jgi:hypothetical protein
MILISHCERVPAKDLEEGEQVREILFQVIANPKKKVTDTTMVRKAKRGKNQSQNAIQHQTSLIIMATIKKKTTRNLRGGDVHVHH